LLVDGTKMAKSAGNFYTLAILRIRVRPHPFRYLCFRALTHPR
jgi:cysteinyl-tRNA synthetase